MNSKKRHSKIKSKAIEKKSGIKFKILIAIIGAALLLAVVYFPFAQGSDTWTVSKDGVLSYPENRGKVDVKVLNITKENNDSLETISFQSKDYTVEGLLRIPSSDKKVPAVVLLPGATVTKEGTQTLAVILSKMGYASLGIEQRNRGGVNMEYDYSLFKDGREPVEHKMVFDGLRAVDVLKQNSRIDSQRIAIIGESNGGRFAIIAAALDPGIKGVIGISTSGYDTESQLVNVQDETLIRFYRSIDPDTYLGFIPPRKLVMMHSVNDNIIPINLAENTFKKAKEPKQFYTVTTGTHGYSEGMRAPLENELKLMFQ
ncbi:MAG: alpha/beta hydrolase [Candidatus Methanoperedens sp.]|nr:alpha/beta hydrolase [Candidatus Methanoperedens sp.]MCZ7403895.1 alpha/beta hydrolase [Candidatus Methanoperedens sp.]